MKSATPPAWTMLQKQADLMQKYRGQYLLRRLRADQSELIGLSEREPVNNHNMGPLIFLDFPYTYCPVDFMALQT